MRKCARPIGSYQEGNYEGMAVCMEWTSSTKTTTRSSKQDSCRCGGEQKEFTLEENERLVGVNYKSTKDMSQAN